MKTKTNTLLGAVLFLLVIGAAALVLPPVALAQAANTVAARGITGDILLETRLKAQGNKHQVQLKWSPADGGDINILRNGAVVATTSDDGKANSNLGTHTGTFTYQVCETDSGDCSSEVTVVVLRDGLVAYYPFDGNANDETGNGYDGTVFGATLSADRFGNPMTAYSFDGSDDKIVIGQEPNFPAWDAYAVSLWFLNDGGGDQGPIYGQKILSKATYDSDFHLAVNWHRDDAVKGNLSWWSAQGLFDSIVDPDTDYRDNMWHHVVLNKKTASRGDLWVDGVLQGSSNLLERVVNTEDLVIGYTTHTDPFQQKYWSGQIDDIRVYNRVLSESEIWELFMEGGSPSLRLEWR